MLLNFTVQDIFSSLLAILLFSSVLVFPGYVIGWAANLFSFRKRTLPAQYVIAMALSNALMPIVLFLMFRFISNEAGLQIVILFFIVWAALQLKPLKIRTELEFTRELKLALALGGIWILFCVLLLVDIQIGQRLYNNAASYDFASRTALIDAITRTGIPPINPGYYPGHFEKITELYYFWYIACSVIDALGGSWVDARIALFAGITWSGLCAVATIATYLRMRNPQQGINAWRASILGAQLLAVSGLDFVPVVAIMIAEKTTFGNLPFNGQIEGWNMPIISWLNALTWVPNHVTGMAACIVAMLAILSSSSETKFRWGANSILAGTAIGSAIGLSIWVTFTFGVFMAVWAISLLFQKKRGTIFAAIIIAGALGLVVASPFLLDLLLRSGGKSQMTGALPIGLYVRHFAFSGGLNPGTREVVGLLLLPINYFFELGFFFMIAVLWVRQWRKSENWQNNYYWAEILLLATVVILLSFIKSTVLALNDLGMRGWLLGQFILIVWGVDILRTSSRQEPWLALSSIKAIPASYRITDLISILLIVGIMTSALEASSTRFWTILVDAGVTGVPNQLTPDKNLGARTYDARLAYEFIRDHTAQNLIIQNNPTVLLDRPSGLYGTRQLVIADRTAYGVPAEVFKEMSASIGRIFKARNVINWASTDLICVRYSIQAIVINDTDPLWSSLARLREQRIPLYNNQHYAVFSCGNTR